MFCSVIQSLDIQLIMTARKKSKNGHYSRREFLALSGAAALSLGFPAIVRAGSRIDKVIVLGIDGMSPYLLRKYLGEGRMPNCRAMMSSGCFRELGTSDPPQSPVAWSNFISGTNPGGHGIFDFIARDAASLLPYLATARTDPPKRQLQLGKFNLPLSSPQTELLRRGPTLWSLLEDNGIDCRVIRAPVNFPPTNSRALTLSGLTTPDVHGSYGVFTFFSSDPATHTRNVAGGRIHRIDLDDGVARCLLGGPSNSFRADSAKINVPIVAHRDPVHPVARIRIQDIELVLREGEWSDWVTVRFPMIPLVAETTGICRLYLRRVHPHFELYVSPVNIDPANPAMPISTPDEFAGKLAREVGKFYTQGMPEDTSALSSSVFTDDEYREQAAFVLEENNRLYEHELDRFETGFFFQYFSSLDLNSHAFWRAIDPGHPLYTPELARKHGDFLPWLYEQMDRAVGRALERADERTLVLAVSDHGFGPFRRQFNLNSWLMENGFATLLPGSSRQESFFQDTDWTRTRAYGLGINSLYLNIRGREPDGTVEPGTDADELRRELIARLTAIRDPQNGEPVIARVLRPEDVFSGPCVKNAPDLIVGYNLNYRASWDTILGAYPQDVLLDNLDPWSGDHCMDSLFLDGVFLCNRGGAAEHPSLSDMAPTILAAFGAPVPREMTGKDVLS